MSILKNHHEKRIYGLYGLLLAALTCLLMLGQITPVLAAKPSLNKKRITISEGENFQLKLKNASSVKWKTSNKAVALVDSKGKVTGKSQGTATVTATVTASDKKKTYKCKVVVKVAGKKEKVKEDGIYTGKDEVALYIHTYNKLPSNFITKKEAQDLGWQGGGLEAYKKNGCIGGDYFGNYEEILPKAEGRKYYECDIDTLKKDSRGAKRIVYSNDGLIFYTEDHYGSFKQLY